VLPEWPPVDYDYTPKLEEHKFRLVKSDRFQFEPETDSKGLKKVSEVEWYPGMFQESAGIILDFRPYDSCPNYHNLRKKDVSELKTLAKQAIEKQLLIWDQSIRKELNDKLHKLSR
jgi:hypothetical protein